MPRIRSIKPELPHSKNLGRTSREARLLFILLFTLVDDEGRARASSRLLASLLFPYDGDITIFVTRWLTELVDHDLVDHYVVDDEEYIQISKWLKHQKIDRPTKSRLPAPPTSPREPSRALDADLGSGSGGEKDLADAAGGKTEKKGDVTSEAYDLADVITRLARHDPSFVPPSWYGAPVICQKWLNAGWRSAVIVASVRRQMARRREDEPGPRSATYFENGIADDVRMVNAPLPAGNVTQFAPKGSRNAEASGLAAIDRICDAVEASRPSDSSGPSEDAVLGLPAGPIPRP